MVRGGSAVPTAVGVLLLALGMLLLAAGTLSGVTETPRSVGVSIDDESSASSTVLVSVVAVDTSGPVTQGNEVTVLNLTDLADAGFRADRVAVADDPTGELRVASSGFSDNGSDPGDRMATIGASPVKLVCDGTTANPSGSVTVSVGVEVSAGSTVVAFTRAVEGVDVDCTQP